MATNGPSKQLQKAREVSKNNLAFHNSAVSAAADSTYALLAGGQGTMYLRNHIADIMEQISRSNSLEFIWAEFRQLRNIEDQLAYLVGSKYLHLVEHGGVGGVTSADDTNWGTDNDIAVRKILDEVMTEIQEQLLNNQDFSESWIVRHAAINRFEVKLNEKERNTLNSLATSFEKIAKDEGLEIMAETMQFHSDSDAQKIVKISEAVSMFSQAGVKIDNALMDQYEKLNEKIKPLRDLDRSYKHMTAMIHSVHDVNKNYTLGLTVAQEEKMLSILAELGVTDPTEFLTRADDQNPLDLKQKLLLLKNKNLTKFTKTIEKNGMKESAFTKQFIGYYSYKNLEQAKADFQAQKIKTFGTKLPQFENDVNAWRGHARNRILSVHGRMTIDRDGHRSFATDEDRKFVSSYFTKFRDLFYASEGDPENHDKMRQIVAALIRTKVPLLTPGSRKFGVSIERVWKSLFRKTPIINKPHLDDAEWVAEIIMNDHLLTNDFYHGNKDVFHTDENKVKYSNALKLSKVGKAGVRNVIAPATKTAAAVTETLLFSGTKLGLNLTRGVSKVGQGFTYLGKETFGGLKNLLNKPLQGGYKWWKTPLYPISGAAWLLEKGMDIANIGSKKIDDGSKKGIDLVNKGHAKLIDLTNEKLDLKDDKRVKNLFQGLGRVWRNTNEFLGKKISEKQENEFQNAILGQQRSAVSAFLELSKMDNELGPLMQSAELCEMLNFKDAGPYLFDEDGRTMNTEKVQAPSKNTPEAATREMSVELDKQLSALMKQAEAEYIKANKSYNEAERGDDEKKKITADVNVTHASEVSNDVKLIKGSFMKLIPLLKSPYAATTNNWRKDDIEAVLKEIGKHMTDPNTNDPNAAKGIKDVLERDIAKLKTDVKTANDKRIEAVTNISTYTNSLQIEQNKLKGKLPPTARDAIVKNINDEKKKLQDALKAKEQHEFEYHQKSRELVNKKQYLGYLKLMIQWVENMQQLNTEMDAAITTGRSTEEISNKMREHTKNMNFMIAPEDNTNVSSSVTDKSEKIKKIMSKAGIDAETKLQLIETLLEEAA